MDHAAFPMRETFESATSGARRKATQRVVVAIALLTSFNPALAHDGHGAHGFAAGLLHPLTGLDHLLAIVTLGWWSTTALIKRWWSVSLAFVAAMLAGAVSGIGRDGLAATEILIVASLLVFGVMLLLRLRLGRWHAALLAAAFAFAHGLAHGSELPANDAMPWLSGLVGATLALHLTGAGIGRLTRERARWATSVAGAASIATGVLLATGLVAG
jgi:urease accessory protein